MGSLELPLLGADSSDSTGCLQAFSATFRQAAFVQAIGAALGEQMGWLGFGCGGVGAGRRHG